MASRRARLRRSARVPWRILSDLTDGALPSRSVIADHRCRARAPARHGTTERYASPIEAITPRQADSAPRGTRRVKRARRTRGPPTWPTSSAAHCSTETLAALPGRACTSRRSDVRRGVRSSRTPCRAQRGIKPAPLGIALCANDLVLPAIDPRRFWPTSRSLIFVRSSAREARCGARPSAPRSSSPRTARCSKPPKPIDTGLRGDRAALRRDQGSAWDGSSG